MRKDEASLTKTARLRSPPETGKMFIRENGNRLPGHDNQSQPNPYGYIKTDGN